ncbi:L-threonylcarbamoyladenylate synthase [Bacillota bacterium]
MDTKIFELNDNNELAGGEIREAAEILKNGGLVAFPTETVYGLGADALNPLAVEKLFVAKGRPSDNPLIVHIADIQSLDLLTPAITPDVKLLADKFWPGPLTLVLPKKAQVPHITTGGLCTVAVRMPDNAIALSLIKESGCVIAAPSANISGHPSPTRGKHVIDDLFGRVDAIIIGEDCKVGIESTVLDMTDDNPVILRPGIITPEQLSRALGRTVAFDPAVLAQSKHDYDQPESADFAPRSPGMKYTHYAPKADMIILEGAPENVAREMQRIKTEQEQSGSRVGLIRLDGKSYEEAARDFFAKLRQLDGEGVDLILAGALSSSDPVGLALMNRMLKAAGYRVLHV